VVPSPSILDIHPSFKKIRIFYKYSWVMKGDEKEKKEARIVRN